MAIVIINPNSTATMTEAMVTAAHAAMPGLRFEGQTSVDGPPAIQGEADGAAATPPLLKLVKDVSAQGAQGIIIGCFDDTALGQAAALARCPVIGLGQASYHEAALRQWRFSVVTTLPASVPVLERNIRHAGLGSFLGRVRASDIPVLALEAEPAHSAQRIREEAEVALAEDDISAIVLGCAGMVQVTQSLRDALPVPVIDPVASAARCMSWLVPSREG